MEACAASRKIGDLGCPRSAGCSKMYSEPASRAAVRMAVDSQLANRADAHDCVRWAVRRLVPIWNESGGTRRTWSKVEKQRWQRSRRRRNAGGGVDRPSREADCGHRPLRTPDGCQWCRIASRTELGKPQCRRGVGRARRRGAVHEANAKRRLSHGQQCARREGSWAVLSTQRVQEERTAARVAAECPPR
eukprot:1047060-Pleurochrysis_carterae.AAC.1